MKTKKEIAEALKAIREVLDTDVSDCDISDVKQKAHKLSCLYGLATEAHASSIKLMGQVELKLFEEMINNKDVASNKQFYMKYLSSKTSEEKALVEYADGIKSSITHTMDMLRTVISHHKSEMDNLGKE